MIYFLDTSALVKRYVAEAGSPLVRGLFARRRMVAVSRIAFAEVAAAAARRRREGALSAHQHARLLDRLEADFSSFVVVEVRQATLGAVPGLCARHPLRAYDAVQLAAALTLRRASPAVDFWTTDHALGRAARAEGLRATPLA
jgi:predicted nucleic acid-binding protein